ncbi:uncharacterized protein LOC111060978 [Nilaparvata lugens]|uniref:uncharacterized protein LOC111060978 n=1 Tax=Nilaparvata lugens TaxID=108931 RepID=UPI00193D0A44|nr:uncharacterized protein LOC111060978 [Nilaparvata lugens]XP_039297520.1 uncharacterized protein LOC111060978 [Nilaparvata lugens]
MQRFLARGNIFNHQLKTKKKNYIFLLDLQDIYTNELWTEDGAMAMLEAELLRSDTAPANLFDEDESLLDLLTRAERQLKQQNLWQYPLHQTGQQQVSSADQPPPSSPHCQQLVVYTSPPPATRAAAMPPAFASHQRIPPTTRISPAVTSQVRIPPAPTTRISPAFTSRIPPATTTTIPPAFTSHQQAHPYSRPRAILASNSIRHEFDFDGLIRFSDPSRRRTIALKHLSDAFQYPVLGARIVRSFNKDAVIIRVANVGRRGNEDAEIETFMPHRFTAKITRANVQSFNSGCHNLIMQVVHSEGRSSDIRLNRRSRQRP